MPRCRKTANRNAAACRKTIAGVHAPSPRLTVLGAAIVAALVALPAGTALWLIEWLWL